MKVLIINVSIDETKSSRSLGGLDNAITMGLYKKYRLGNNDLPWNVAINRLTANHMYDKYTFIDEKTGYVGSFRTMNKLIEKIPFIGNCLTVTTEQWLDKHYKGWRENPRNQYW